MSLSKVTRSAKPGQRNVRCSKRVRLENGAAVAVVGIIPSLISLQKTNPRTATGIGSAKRVDHAGSPSCTNQAFRMSLGMRSPNMSRWKSGRRTNVSRHTPRQFDRAEARPGAQQVPAVPPGPVQVQPGGTLPFQPSTKFRKVGQRSVVRSRDGTRSDFLLCCRSQLPETSMSPTTAHRE